MKQNGIEKLGAHDEILQAQNVAYSNVPKIFVNGLSRPRGRDLHSVEGKSVDMQSSSRIRVLERVSAYGFVEKLRTAEDN